MDDTSGLGAAPRRVVTRAAVQAAAVAGAAVAVPALTAAPAHAKKKKPRYRVAPYRRTAVPSAASRHLLSRFSYGWTPALQRQVDAAGGPQAWFDRQLAGGYSDAFYQSSRAWWSSIDASVATLWERAVAETEPIWVQAANYVRWVLARRIHSERQVLEVMTDFWENHLHVPATGEGWGLFRTGYGKVIREHALGRYEDLLYAAVTHPAMGVYLNNAISTRRAPNENLGRELLELHTVGLGAGYTEDDVKASARILTGWRVDVWRTWEVYYDEDSHWTGPVSVLGFSDPNADPDGQALTRRYLSYLARHPATARRVARKLAVRFVSDSPSAALVEHLAQVYLAHDTAIVPVLRALVAHREFAAAAGLKVRTPEEDVVATYRALGVKMAAPAGRDNAAANAVIWQTGIVGAAPFAWPRPDGRPDAAEAWTSAARFLGSLQVHYTMAGGWWPKVGATYLKPAKRLPEKQIRFDRLVDHLARTLTGRPSTARLLKACCQAVDLPPTEMITARHGLVRWSMPRLLTTILDHPNHMTR